MTMTLLSASGAALIGVVAVVSKSRFGSSRARGGYNCCEYCAHPLPRDPDHTWRYSGTCAKCGRAQPWAGATTNA
jgi:hypothetical protein